MKKEDTELEAVNGMFKINLRVNGVKKTFNVKNTEFLLDALRRHGNRTRPG